MNAFLKYNICCEIVLIIIIGSTKEQKKNSKMNIKH